MKLTKNLRNKIALRVKPLVLINLLFVSFFITSYKTYADISIDEKEALLDLYQKTNGKDWNTTWDIDMPVSSWYGITVKNNQVVKINLFHNNLSGVLPASIADLKHLTELNLAFNQLTGELPNEIVALEELIILKLEMNRLKGALPENLGKMTQLQELSLFNNFISGSIPNSLGDLKKLRILNLSSNNFKGSIPNSIGNLENLESLGLFENSLEGNMPSEFGNLAKLKELVLANNKLEGAIPKELGQLASLEIIQIQNNGFDSFEDITSMKSNNILVFDFDKEKIDISPKFKNINTINTRIVDTKFEDEDENND
tara:strand:- start:1306 stop:2247 length:942 start_codon:yes stop_codon:yes gene_type:complete